MMQNEKLALPIDIYLPEIVAATQNYSTILVKASPGSGKTTRLPWALTKSFKKVAVLEPRRLAAKLAATRIASEEALNLGEEVGYHFRFEKNTGSKTRLVFYTEGTFLKRFISDPYLNDIDVVVLDEFHERHLDTDLALALLLDLQTRRKDLKIILMSATLDEKILSALPNPRLFEIEAPLFPVEISYLPNQPSILNQSLELKVKKAVESLSMTSGDVLIFVPGMREMLKIKDTLHSHNVFLLHADLEKDEQEKALTSSEKRKIILATNIAESSLTIPGIRVVIDSGTQREAHYSAWNGLKFIEDRPVTKSSAIQRAGRAGRTAPGICLRLYSQQDFNERADHTIPEIEKADLTDTCLLIKSTGLGPQWFHAPPEEKWQKALKLLEQMNALTAEGKITSIGQKMLEIPLDSRLARILVEGEKLPRKKKEQLLDYICFQIEEDRSGTLKRRMSFYLKSEGSDHFPWESCLIKGFVDQVAKIRPKQRDLIHYSGRTLKLHSSLDNLMDDYFIVLNITQRQEAIKIFPVEEEWIWGLEPFPFTEEDEIQIDENITIRRKTKFGSIVVEENILKLTWSELDQSVKDKINILSQSMLKQKIARWQESTTYGRFDFWSRHKKLNMEEVFTDLKAGDFFQFAETLKWEGFEEYLKNMIEEKFQITSLDLELPLKMNLGGRRELLIHYPVGMDPYLEAPIQDFYGLSDTPRIIHGQLPLTLKLLGPHKRPIQVTKDLINFWNKTYQEMKKEYQREYPRHYWPEKPWEARPILLKSQLPKV